MDQYKDAALFKDHYKSAKYPQPSTVIEGGVQSDKYYLAWARFVYSLWTGGAAATFPEGLYQTRAYGSLRAYGRGVQPVEKYRNIIDVRVKDGTIIDNGHTAIKEASLLNISWDNWHFYPKYKALAISKVLETEYGVTVRARDTESAMRRRKKFATAKLSVDPRMQQLFGLSGVVPSESKDFVGMSGDDIQTILETGGFALEEEAVMEDLAQVTFEQNDGEDILRLMLNDKFDLNRMAFVVEKVETQNRLKIKYVDAAKLIIPISTYNDHRTDGFRAYMEKINLSDLRAESGLEEKEIWEIAKSYSGFGTNVSTKDRFGVNLFNMEWRERYLRTSGQQVYDHFSVDVLNLWFVASSVESMVIGFNPDGSLYANNVDSKYVLSEDEIAAGMRIESNKVQYVHKVKWVVGTNKVFGYGIDHTVVREGEDGCKQALIPLVVWAGDEPSMTENCIAIIDDIQLAVLKTRLLLSNLPPGPRMLIDMSILDNAVNFGSTTYSMKELLALFGATGKLLVRSRNEWGSGNAANRPAITPIESGIHEDFDILSRTIASGLDMIRQTTGINEVADGTGSPNNVLKSVQSGFVEAANNALKPHQAALERIYKSMMSIVIKKYQALALYGEISVSKWPLDANSFSILKVPENIWTYEFDIALRELPTQDDINMLMQQVFQHQQSGVIQSADMFVVLNMLKAKDVKKAEIYLARAVERGTSRNHEQEMQRISAQGDANAKAVSAGEQARQATIQAEYQGKMKLAQLEHMLNQEAAAEDHKRKITEIHEAAKAGVTGRIIEKSMDTEGDESEND